MNLERNKSVGKTGEKIGYAFGYFMFTTILFLALTLTNKIPASWTYFHIMGVTLAIALTGTLFKRLLK
ncbi:MAG: hypothetical protein HYW24_03870 [Candidatus Aenigmarchaeota archaeon]|nr:hypothetical protein [Candidatus Aenigmarchaeota archaeon]